MSLRLRLLIAVAVVALVALAGTDLVTFSTFRASLDSELDTTLRRAAGPVEACLGRGGKLTPSLLEETTPELLAEVVSPRGAVETRIAAITLSASERRHGYGPRVDLASAGLASLHPGSVGNEPVSDDCLGARPVTPANALPRPGQLGTGAYFTTAAAGAYHPSFRVRISPLPDGRVLVLSLPFSQTADTLRRLAIIEAAVSAAALVVAVALGAALVRLGFRPLIEVERTAEEIVGGDLEARVPERYGEETEVGRLTFVLNSMLGRLSDEFAERDRTAVRLAQSENRMREFLADASHELRTPIAAISAYAELFSSGAASRPADLSRVLAGIRSETARMSTLVEDLVLLASLDEGRPLERRPVELVALAADAVRAARAIAPEWPVDLVATDSVEVEGDEARLRQVVDNLLSNVRAHTPEGTTATVRVYRRSSKAVVEVADHGPGLGEGSRDRVFERFFREDTSRSRSSGGAGLGLAIVRAIAAAHGGAVEAGETPGGGATFVVLLPAYELGDNQRPPR